MSRTSTDGTPRLRLRKEETDRGTVVHLTYNYERGLEVRVNYESNPYAWIGYPNPDGPTYLPTIFHATVADPDLPYEVSCQVGATTGTPRLIDLRVKRHFKVDHVPVVAHPGDEEATFPQEPISSEGLRRIPVNRILKICVRAATATEVEGDDMLHAAEVHDLRDFIGSDAARKPTRGVAIDDDHYRQVADVYRQATALGASPRQAVASWGSVAESTASKWVRGARDRGFLPPTSQGRASS